MEKSEKERDFSERFTLTLTLSLVGRRSGRHLLSLFGERPDEGRAWQQIVDK